MTKVVEIARTSEYWVSRAHKHRLAGRYDEAMALLGKTREQYGTSEALERELAQTYSVRKSTQSISSVHPVE